MISRVSTRALADLYCLVFYHHFANQSPRFQRDALHRFLYDREYPLWLLTLIKHLNDGREITLRPAILGLHTGETFRNVFVTHTSNVPASQGQVILKKLAEDILSEEDEVLIKRAEYSGASRQAIPLRERLLNSLDIDGYEYRNGRLYRREASTVDSEQSSDLITDMLASCGLDNNAITLNHMEMATKHYIDGNWGDCISQSRNFMESVLQEIAAQIYSKLNGRPIPKSIYDRAGDVRKYLDETVQFFDKPEVEAVAKFYGLLSDTGNHPYLAENDQARFARTMALVVAEFSLIKMEAWRDAYK